MIRSRLKISNQEYSMKRWFSSSLILFAVVTVVFAQKADVPLNPGSLVEAERAFAAASVAKGTRDAFLENLADDSVLFHPGPVDGKKWWREQPVRPGVLTWQPIFASVSRAGDLGYTTGPWEFREKSLDDKPVASGYFVSIWKRQAGGVWKVVLDLGTRNPQPQTPAPVLQVPRDYPVNTKSKPKVDVEAARSTLIKTEDDFSKLLAGKNTVDSFLSYLADDVRLYRTNAFPVIGKEASGVALAAKPGQLTWQNVKTDVSTSGDLGYTYGAYEFKASGDSKTTESGNYMRIWKKQANGKWRVVLDLLNPIPPATAN
jgi:ketosteroid isomerase-like protein